MKRISLQQMIKAMSGCLVNEGFLKEGFVQNVVHDSRDVHESDLYFAIVGERVDGHDYIEKAFENGALLAVSEKRDKIPFNRPVILVDDTVKALGDLAAFYRGLFTIPFIGITGSVGKTSTKEMVASILSQKYKVHKTEGNHNNNIGMPMTILKLEESDEVAVIEMGMDRFGEIDYLSSILRPDYGIITNIGVSHIEFLGSREGILKAKIEMLPYIAENGRILLNGDDALLMSIANNYGRKVLTYGNDASNNCRIVEHKVTRQGQTMTVATDKTIYCVEVTYPGDHILFNGLAGILIGELLGLEKNEIIKGMQTYVGASMRLQQFEVKGRIRILDDAYNASVESMKSALKTLMSIRLKEERTVAILGSMFEMGNYSEEGHQLVGEAVSMHKPEVLLIAGKEARAIYDKALELGYDVSCAFYYEEIEDLMEDLDQHIKEKDLVLLKASRGMHYEQIREKILRKYEG